MKKETVSRFNEKLMTSNDLALLKGKESKYLMNSLYRRWKEDFTDEDTGEVVTIERKELIISKGEELNDENFQTIDFFIKSGELNIKDVRLSSIQRTADAVLGNSTIWTAAVEISRKKRTFYLYANSIDVAREIITDYIEQNYIGFYEIKSLKEQQYFTLVSLAKKNSDEEQNKFYQIEVEIMVNKESYPMRFLVKAPNAEEAKVLSEAFYETYMRVADDDKELPPYTMTLLSAKTLNVEAVIDHQFCKEYIDKSKETL